GGRFKAGTDDEVAIQEELNTFKGVDRIVRHAFAFAKNRGLTKVCMADKSNAMQQGHALWQRVFKQVASEYSGIQATHYYIDALAMYMVLDPGQLEVIVTNNLFGDIVTDLAAAVCGGIGLAASGNIDATRTNPSMFEPVHGSAPDIAGQGVADPTAAIMSVALLLSHVGEDDAAARVDKAVEHHLATRGDEKLSTTAVGDRIAASL
ncbi:MAG TPA: isocitrate/isopropylmalate family dehydrogenase, partial [Steroidobacteraceae bacterium]|nr:isocitrate/isopropylmalate family dehydrogenase [Steroidobacteraceae bacterium]